MSITLVMCIYFSFSTISYFNEVQFESSFSDNKPAVIPKKRKFSNVSLDSVDSLLDDEVLFTRRDKFPVRLLPMNRSQTSESEISLEQTTEERDSSSTTVELVEQQCTPVSPSRPSVELITTCDNDHERKRLKKKRKHRKHKHGHDELRTKHKHKHHKKHHKKHKKRKDSEPELSVSEPPTLSPQTPAEEVRIDDDDDDKSRENDSSEVDSSDVPAFLSDQQIWKWSGDSYKRPGRGGNKKTFYKSISRGDETISIGDCAVFLSSGRPDRPFIGKVDCMWETNMEKMQVKVFWFYHPEETASGFTGDLPYPGALFKSPHNDINDVQSIMNGCQVVSFEEFKTVVEKDPERLDAIYDNNDLFYLAGDYEPVMKMITFCDGVTATSSDKI
uniref:Protein winged eye n=1 Tax=Sipha flava TaxID=143950 RepID=A0A2S2QNS2_9HEMI